MRFLSELLFLNFKGFNSYFASFLFFFALFNFQGSICVSIFSISTFLLYHLFRLLSRPFRDFFTVVRSVLTALPDSLIIIAHLSAFVNYFFHVLCFQQFKSTIAKHFSTTRCHFCQKSAAFASFNKIRRSFRRNQASKNIFENYFLLLLSNCFSTRNLL